MNQNILPDLLLPSSESTSILTLADIALIPIPPTRPKYYFVSMRQFETKLNFPKIEMFAEPCFKMPSPSYAVLPPSPFDVPSVSRAKT